MGGGRTIGRGHPIPIAGGIRRFGLELPGGRLAQAQLEVGVDPVPHPAGRGGRPLEEDPAAFGPGGGGLVEAGGVGVGGGGGYGGCRGCA